MKHLSMRWFGAVLASALIFGGGLVARAQNPPTQSPQAKPSVTRPLLGVRAMDVEGQLGQYFQVPGGRGILVVEVMSGTPAEKAGMKAGDVIYQVAGKTVQGARQLEQALQDNCSANGVSIAIVRKGMTLVLRTQIDCPKPPEPADSSV